MIFMMCFMMCFLMCVMFYDVIHDIFYKNDVIHTSGYVKAHEANPAIAPAKRVLTIVSSFNFILAHSYVPKTYHIITHHKMDHKTHHKSHHRITNTS